VRLTAHLQQEYDPAIYVSAGQPVPIIECPRYSLLKVKIIIHYGAINDHYVHALVKETEYPELHQPYDTTVSEIASGLAILPDNNADSV
jgi:hypothetical protein